MHGYVDGLKYILRMRHGRNGNAAGRLAHERFETKNRLSFTASSISFLEHFIH
jgi:hypothetical protein